MQNDYRLTNGATIGDFLIACTTVSSFECSERGYELLVAMIELLLSIKNTDPDPASIDNACGNRIETLARSFLSLFRLWLDATWFTVPTLEDATFEDAFIVLFGASAMVDIE